MYQLLAQISTLWVQSGKKAPSLGLMHTPGRGDGGGKSLTHAGKSYPKTIITQPLSGCQDLAHLSRTSGCSFVKCIGQSRAPICSDSGTIPWVKSAFGGCPTSRLGDFNNSVTKRGPEGRRLRQQPYLCYLSDRSIQEGGAMARLVVKSLAMAALI